MSKRSARTSPVASVAGQFRAGAGVIGYVWGHPANSGRRGRALLRASEAAAPVRRAGELVR